MNIHDATEVAYRNGYKAGYQAGVKEFAKTLRARAFNDAYGYYIVVIDQITELEKEMVGGRDE
jgi:hypothetical protein